MILQKQIFRRWLPLNGTTIVAGSLIFSWSHACTFEKNRDSSTKIVGGSLAEGYQEVKMLLVDKIGLEICTAVAVSDSTLLLAAHCLKNGSLSLSIRAPQTQVDAKGMYAWNRLTNRKYVDKNSAARDLAVLVYPKGTFQGPFAKIASTGAGLAGQQVTLVGFGATEFGKSIELNSNATIGQKNKGINNIIFAMEGVIGVEAALDRDNKLIGNVAVAASGDSGSPLYLNDSQELIGISSGVGATDKDGVVLNLTSAGELDLADAKKIQNLYVDLTSPVSQRLLSQAVFHGADIPGVSPLATLPNEDQYWVQRPQEGEQGEGQFKAIAFGLVKSRGFGLLQGQTNPSTQGQGRTATGLFSGMNFLMSGFFSGRLGNGAPLISVGGPNVRPPAGRITVGSVPNTLNYNNFINSGSFTTAARPSTPVVRSPVTQPALSSQPATRTTPTQMAVPASTVAQAAVDKSNTDAIQQAKAEGFWNGVNAQENAQNEQWATGFWDGALGKSQQSGQTTQYSGGYDAGKAANQGELNSQAQSAGKLDAQNNQYSWNASHNESEKQAYQQAWDTQTAVSAAKQDAQNGQYSWDASYTESQNQAYQQAWDAQQAAVPGGS